ncbi:MAG: carbohydrate ABC transporter permease, partial [Lachnospiraceae bacterium]|nr:carbohydrate ABC transporter permease [Lachnospiraceae bacterium]
MKRKERQNLWRHIILISVGFFLLYPVIFMVFASFKNSNEIFASPNLLPEKWLFENYTNGWLSGATGTITFTNFFINTFVLVIPVVA